VIGVYDETRELLNINPITLFYSDRRMERAYEFYHKTLSINYSKTLLIIYLVAFSAYILENIIKNPKFDYLFCTEIAIVSFGVFLLMFMKSKIYEKTYYKSINLVLAASILVKVLFDWSFIGFDLSFSAILVILCSSLSIHLKINFTFLFCFNLGFLISYILR